MIGNIQQVQNQYELKSPKFKKLIFTNTKIALQYVHSNSFYCIKKELRWGILIFAYFNPLKYALSCILWQSLPHTVNDYRTIIGWFIRKSFVIFVYRQFRQNLKVHSDRIQGTFIQNLKECSLKFYRNYLYMKITQDCLINHPIIFL